VTSLFGRHKSHNRMNLERKRSDGVQGLPGGWKREEVVRRKGLSAGKIDVFYSRYSRLTFLSV